MTVRPCLSSLCLALLPVLAAPAFAAETEAPVTIQTITAQKRWLHLPVKNGAKRTPVTIFCKGEMIRTFDAELADGSPDWWAPLDIGPWQGSTLTIEAQGLAAGSAALKNLRQTDEKITPEDVYREPLRPQFHFTSRTGRLNDPNGLLYFGGKYHLFFQFAPFSYGSGAKHWGHATSTDLVHWEEQDIALYPDERGHAISGSGVVDVRNTSGFGAENAPPIVLTYTVAGKDRFQGIATSLDGKSFTPQKDLQVVRNITPKNRDPKVFWHEPTKRWVMALYVGVPHETLKDEKGKPLRVATIHFLTSPDLKNYEPASVFRGGTGEDRYLHECPDVFSLPVEGEPENVKWIISGANGEYQIGQFDGKTFTPEGPKLPSFVGNRYAGQTFSNAPDGRLIQMGWMIYATFPGMPFDQCMNVPVELKLKRTPDGLRLASMPVPELDQLRRSPVRIPPQTLKPGQNPLQGIDRELFDLETVIDPGTAKTITFRLRGTEVIYDAAAGTLRCSKFTAPLPLVEGKIHLRILGDRTILEIFGADGLFSMPVAKLPCDGNNALSLECSGGEAALESLTVYEMTSAWPQP